MVKTDLPRFLKDLVVVQEMEFYFRGLHEISWKFFFVNFFIISIGCCALCPDVTYSPVCLYAGCTGKLYSNEKKMKQESDT